MAMNSERQKKYDVFIKLHKKTYPLLEKKKQYTAGQDLQNQGKKDLEKHEKMVLELKERKSSKKVATIIFF